MWFRWFFFCVEGVFWCPVKLLLIVRVAVFFDQQGVRVVCERAKKSSIMNCFLQGIAL